MYFLATLFQKNWTNNRLLAFTSSNFVVVTSFLSDINDYLLTKFDTYYFGQNDLVIHIRSGDIFVWPHPFYAQPPLSFYLDIIKSRIWDSVTLIAEDRRNPCINPLLMKIKGIKFKAHDMHTDISILLSAKNLAVGFGTFGTAILKMSKRIENVYMFNHNNRNMFRAQLKSLFNCVPSYRYYTKMINKWRNKNEQRQIMINDTCSRWEFVYQNNSKINISISNYSIVSQ